MSVLIFRTGCRRKAAVGSLNGRGPHPRGRPPHRTAGEGPLPAPRKGEAELQRHVGTRRDCSQLSSEKVTYFLVYLFHAR